MNIKSGTTVVWRWPSYFEAGDVHDVKLARGPKGVKRFHSEAASSDYTFKRRLTVRGSYRVVCTLHEGMGTTIRVR
jgi:plastocyanin